MMIKKQINKNSDFVADPVPRVMDAVGVVDNHAVVAVDAEVEGVDLAT